MPVTPLYPMPDMLFIWNNQQRLPNWLAHFWHD